MSDYHAPRPRRASSADGWVEIYRDPRERPPARALDDDIPTDIRPRARQTSATPSPSAASRSAEATTSTATTHRPASVYTSSQRRFRLSVFFTVLSTFVMGLGLIGARRKPLRWLGVIAAVTVIAVGVTGVGFLLSQTDSQASGGFLRGVLVALIGIASTGTALHILTAILIGMGLIWVMLIAFTHIKTRPEHLSRGKRITGAILVGVLSLGVAVPTAVAAQYTQVLARTLGDTFTTQPNAGDGQGADGQGGDGQAGPFSNQERLNILLLGSDMDTERLERGAQEGFGLRTDTIMVASIDTATGETAIVQIPRNVQYTPFPPGTELARLYPDGFTGAGTESDWFINGLWDRVSSDHPELFVGSEYPGAEALKLGVEGITGLPIDYFVLLNMDGLQNLIDAMGGVTVNINERLPIGGSSNNKVATGGYLEVGPDQKLNGYEALWYARSRWADSNGDYGRMARQSCLVGAIIKQADPVTLLTRFEAIAGASSQMTMTDIPSDTLQPLTQLALKVQDQPLKRLVFAQGKNGYLYNNPDFDAMRMAVDNLIAPSEPSAAPSPTEAPSPAASDSAEALPTQESVLSEGTQSVTDACAFNPVEEQE